jgi:hypothetical protein
MFIWLKMENIHRESNYLTQKFRNLLTGNDGAYREFRSAFRHKIALGLELHHPHQDGVPDEESGNSW